MTENNPLHNALDALNKTEEPKAEEVKTETTEQVEQKEEIQQEVHSNIEENKVEESTEEIPNETTPEITDDLIFAKLGEMLGREVKSQEDLFVEKEVVKEVPKDYLTDFGKGYEEYFKETGRTPQDYLNLNRDVQSMTQEQVIKEILKKENPSFDSRDLSDEYNDRYVIDEEEMTDAQIRRIERRKKSDYDKGVKQLEADKEKYLVAKDNSIKSIESKQQEQQKLVEEQSRLWIESVEKTNSEIKGVEIDLGEGFKFTHAIPQEALKKVKEIAIDNTMTKWAERYQQEDGSLDTKKIQKGLYIEDNLDSIIADAVEQAIARTTEDNIKKDKNIDFDNRVKAVVKPKLTKEAERDLDLYQHTYKRYKK